MGKNQLHRKHIGTLGESIACEFLIQKGFAIQGRNYREKWGEIDIIASKGDVVYFVEVKTVIQTAQNEHNEDNFSPEDNIHPQKIKRITRTIASYLRKEYKGDAPHVEWQIDAVIVLLDTNNKKATMRHIECIGS